LFSQKLSGFPVLNVDRHTGEALSFLLALRWLQELLHLDIVDFELDSKRVVDYFRSRKEGFLNLKQL
jgi:hypothetical protein